MTSRSCTLTLPRTWTGCSGPRERGQCTKPENQLRYARGERDLRQTPLYREIEAHFEAALGPAFDAISGASDPAPSPDGRIVAFTESRLRRLEGMPETRICLAALPTGPIEEITCGPHDDLMPRWSPDGSQLAFLSDRAKKGMHQLCLLARGRLGEALGTPWIEGMVEYLAWSPDGQSILLGVAGPGADIADAQGAGTTVQHGEDLPSWMPAVDSGVSENKSPSGKHILEPWG